MNKILVVEDESIIAMNLEEDLTAMDYEVVGIAASGDEAIEKARELCPDLILMAIAMPGEKDGIDASNEIKSEMDVPIIFLTAFADKELIKRAKMIEPDGYIVKPYEDREVRAAIEVALHKKYTEKFYKRLQRVKKRNTIAKLREQETKIKELETRNTDRAAILKEYIGLIILEILVDTNEKRPIREKDLMKAIQRKSCIPIDSETLHVSLNDLERKGILKEIKGFLSEAGLFFYLRNVKEIDEKGIYGAFLAKFTARGERIQELEELIWSSRR